MLRIEDVKKLESAVSDSSLKEALHLLLDLMLEREREGSARKPKEETLVYEEQFKVFFRSVEGAGGVRHFFVPITVTANSYEIRDGWVTFMRILKNEEPPFDAQRPHIISKEPVCSFPENIIEYIVSGKHENDVRRV